MVAVAKRGLNTNKQTKPTNHHRSRSRKRFYVQGQEERKQAQQQELMGSAATMEVHCPDSLSVSLALGAAVQTTQKIAIFCCCSGKFFFGGVYIERDKMSIYLIKGIFVFF